MLIYIPEGNDDQWWLMMMGGNYHQPSFPLNWHFLCPCQPCHDIMMSKHPGIRPRNCRDNQCWSAHSSPRRSFSGESGSLLPSLNGMIENFFCYKKIWRVEGKAIGIVDHFNHFRIQSPGNIHIHTYTHTHTHIYIYSPGNTEASIAIIDFQRAVRVSQDTIHHWWWAVIKLYLNRNESHSTIWGIPLETPDSPSQPMMI